MTIKNVFDMYYTIYDVLEVRAEYLHNGMVGKNEILTKEEAIKKYEFWLNMKAIAVNFETHHTFIREITHEREIPHLYIGYIE